MYIVKIYIPIILSPTFPVFPSILTTLTRTSCPTSRNSFGSFTNRLSEICDTCMSQSLLSPISTNAPKATTFFTIPSTISHSLTSVFFLPSVARLCVDRVRFSTPAFRYEFMINSIVSAVASGYISSIACLFSSKNCQGEIFSSQSSRTNFASAYCSGCMSVLSSGSGLSGIRRNPTACS